MTADTLKKSYVCRTEAETIELGRRLAAAFRPGDVVALYGSVGAGKTTLIRGICQAYAIDHTSSPTFVIMNEHQGIRNGLHFTVRHFDFYRVHTEKDLAELGIDDFLNDPDSLALIEWSENVAAHLPSSLWNIRIRAGDHDERRLEIEQPVDR